MRPLLHAQRLERDHPVTDMDMAFEAQVADNMMEIVRFFGQQERRLSYEEATKDEFALSL